MVIETQPCENCGVQMVFEDLPTYFLLFDDDGNVLTVAPEVAKMSEANVASFCSAECVTKWKRSKT